MTIFSTIRNVLLLSLTVATVGCHKGPYDGLDPNLRAAYEKADKEDAELKKLPPEEQIRRVQNNPNMPEMYKQSFIAKIRAQAQKKP